MKAIQAAPRVSRRTASSSSQYQTGNNQVARAAAFANFLRLFRETAAQRCEHPGLFGRTTVHAAPKLDLGFRRGLADQMPVHKRSRHPFHFVVKMPHARDQGRALVLSRPVGFLLPWFEGGVACVCIVLYRASVGSAIGARLDINIGDRFSSVVAHQTIV